MESTWKLPLILGTPFLATTGARMDYPNKKAVLLHVDEKVYYPITPAITPFCGKITHTGENFTDAEVKDEPIRVDKGSLSLVNHEYDEGILDETCLTFLFEEPMGMNLVVNAPRSTKAKPGEKKDLTLSLHPMKYVDGAIEYKVKCMGSSKPFSKAKVILTPGMNEKELAIIKETMARVFKIELTDWGPCFEDGPNSTSA